MAFLYWRQPMTITCTQTMWSVRVLARAFSAFTLVHAFTSSSVDYCNAVIAFAPKVTTDKLQHVLNAVAHGVPGTTSCLIAACRGSYTGNYTGSTFPKESCSSLSSWCSAVFTTKRFNTSLITVCQSLTLRQDARESPVVDFSSYRGIPAESVRPTGLRCGWFVGLELFAWRFM